MGLWKLKIKQSRHGGVLDTKWLVEEIQRGRYDFGQPSEGHVCVCVCVFFPSILDIKFVGRTSRGHTGGRSHRIFNPPSFCGACLDFCREKDSAIPFPRRPWSRILCTNELIVLHPLGIFFLFFFVFSEKNPVCRDRTHVPTCQKVTRCRLSYRGRPCIRHMFVFRHTPAV